MNRANIWLLGALALAMCVPAAALAEPTAPARDEVLPPRDILAPVTSCDSLAKQDFSGAVGAPVSIASAEIAPATATQAEFCLVKGYFAPQVRFELRLPTKTYTGRYLQGGCGGACGEVKVWIAPDADTALALGGAFAVGFNDSGHSSNAGTEAGWADGAPALRADFAYRANHISVLLAKAVIAAYYGQPPAISYFDGCSNGGRGALMEAQRYPDDFSGVISGAPAVWITPGVVKILWESRVDTGPDDRPILTREAAQTLHAAVLKACDRLDGAVDGQIDDPRLCRFDPHTLICRPGEAPDGCLTAEQADVAAKLYQGPVDEAGRPLYLGGEPYGSELTWAGPGSFTNLGPTLAGNQIRYMIFDGDPLPGFSWKTWKLDDKAVRSLLEHGGYYDASDGDLGAFRRGGGKLILWQGWTDNAAGPYVLPDYYQRVRDAAGGLDAARTFARMFMLPGVYHCGGGYTPYQANLLAPLARWVETGAAPERIDATVALPDGAQRTRPIFPYPTRAQYRGSGDMNDPANFAPATPAQAPDDHFHWAGETPPAGSGPVAGNVEGAYVFAPTGQTVKYRLYLPASYNGARTLPLVVILHGFGGDQNSAFDEAPPELKGALEQQADRQGFILLAPAGYDGKGDYGAHLPLPVLKTVQINHSPQEDDLAQADVMDAIAQVEADYKVDRGRVYLMGNSMGMTGTLELAQKFPQTWCAIAPSDGPPWPDYPADRLKGVSGAIFVNGDLDRIAPTATNRTLAQRVRAEGVDTQFIEVPNGDHGGAWYMALPQIFDFFAAHPCGG